MKFQVVPLNISEANLYVERVHRHHGAVRGARFAIGLTLGDRMVGVAIVGRPVARHLDDGFTVEVTRVATDGTRNACSALYSRAARAAVAMGYRKVITYTLSSESGSSLSGAGWRVVAQVKGRTWSRPKRERVDKHPTQDKLRWEARLVDSSVRGKESKGLTPATAPSEGPQELDYRRPSTVDPLEVRDALYRSVGIDPDESYSRSRSRT